MFLALILASLYYHFTFRKCIACSTNIKNNDIILLANFSFLKLRSLKKFKNKDYFDLLSVLEAIAKRLNIPIGALLCLLLTIGGIYIAIFEPYLMNRTNDVLIGVGLWGIAFIVCWFSYGEEFWMSPKNLEKLRSTEFMDNSEDIDTDEKK